MAAGSSPMEAEGRVGRAHLRVHVAIALFACAMLALLWTAMLLHVADERAGDVAEVEGRNANLAAVLEEQTVHTFKGTNQALSLVKYELERSGRVPDVHALVERGALDDSLFDRIEIVDEFGHVLGHGDNARSVADLDFFQYLRGRRTNELFVSRPAFEPGTDRWVIELARRADKPDGSFAGVVFAAVNTAYFTRIYRRDELYEQGLVAVVGRDGVVRATRVGDHDVVGQDGRASRLLAEQSRSPTGTFIATDPYEGVERFYSYRTLRDYPFIVAVGSSTQESLAGWREHARDYYVSAGLASALIVCVASGSMIAIALKRRSFRTLARSEARYREIFTHTRDGIVVLERERRGIYRVVDANGAFETISGLPAGALHGRGVEELLPGAALFLTRHIERCAARGGPVAFARDVELPAGPRNLDVTLVPMGEPPGGLPRIMAVIRDRTESHRAASALRSADAASRAKTEFLATVSHELREPLNGVLGMFQLLARTPLDRDQVMMLELLQSSGHSLLGVVEDLLDFSRIEAGTLHLDPQPTSMARLVETVASVYHAPGAARGVRILHSCDPRVSPALLADAVRMRQVVSSLVANALECAREGPVEIAVELLQRVEGDDVIRIVVADAGAGLPANDRARHFEPLAGGPETLPGRAALGLAICRRLVLLMGGALDVSTREGGIRVALTFRLRITEPTVQTASVHALERPVRQVTGPG